MEMLAFLIIVGVWAVFLLPSFFENHRSASLSSTRKFARNNDLLASVALQSTDEVRVANGARRRRRRAVFLLGTGALASLGAAILTGSTLWLGLTIIFDVLLAAFVTALLQAKAAQFAPVATVVPIEQPVARVEELSEVEVIPTVRIVAG
jgi:hypothetical protein